jgi:predicted dehydrogenase
MHNKCLLIGLGQIGMGFDLQADQSKVYSHARAFSTHPFFELSGAVDPSEEKRNIFKKIYERPVFSSLLNALQKTNPDIVVVAVPTEMHYQVINDVLDQSNASIILCEKPLSFDIKEARLIVAACTKKGVQLFVNFIRRSDRGALEVQQRIANGLIATPVKGTSWYTKGFLHNGSHFFNLLEFWLGKMIHSKELSAGRIYDSKYPEPDIYVEFEKGNIVFLAGREEAFSYYNIELLSPSGRLRYENSGELIRWEATQTDPNFPGYSMLKKEPEIITNGMDRYQWHVTDQLAKLISGEPSSLCTGKEALLTLESMHQTINKNKHE